MTKKQLICETIGNCTNDGSDMYLYDLGHGISVCAIVFEPTLEKVVKELMTNCFQDGRQFGTTYDI